MDGTIEVYSDIGKGSIFNIKIPFKKTIGKSKILVAEDDLVNQKVITKMLTQKGYEVLIVNNGEEVLSAIESDKFDLILMDIFIPKMNGYETTQKIREKEKDSGVRLPIVAVTAYAFSGDKEVSLRVGMDDYISNPIICEELYRVIENLINK